MTNILVTAAGSPGFITICKSIKSSLSIKKSSIYACDMNLDSVGLKFAKKTFKVPSGNNSSYVDAIFSICKENNIDLIIPCSDEELIPLSKNLLKFESINCKIMVSDFKGLEIALNKKNLFNFLIKNYSDIVPKHRYCRNIKDFELHYKDLLKETEKICVKPSQAHGSRGFRIIDNSFSKEDFFKKKPDSLKISYENLHSILSQGDKKFPELILMEYLPGEEFSVDSIQDKEKFYCVTRRRNTIKEGICSSGETIEKKDLIKICKTIYRDLELDYNINFQFRYDSKGNPKILEINPRLSGTLELCRGAGINFVDLGIKNVLDLKDNISYEVKWGIKMQRVWEEVFFDEEDIYTLESIKQTLREL
jgi:carbamoyl-phosphate synthase large subunit